MREPGVLPDSPPARLTRHAVVRFPDEVDMACAGDLRERMLVLLNRGATLLAADLSGTTFCDCSGLNALLRARTRAQALGTPFGMVLPRAGPVWRFFRISGVSELLPHEPTLDELVRHLGVPPPR